MVARPPPASSAVEQRGHPVVVEQRRPGSRGAAGRPSLASKASTRVGGAAAGWDRPRGRRPASDGARISNEGCPAIGGRPGAVRPHGGRRRGRRRSGRRHDRAVPATRPGCHRGAGPAGHGVFVARAEHHQRDDGLGRCGAAVVSGLARPVAQLFPPRQHHPCRRRARPGRRAPGSRRRRPARSAGPPPVRSPAGWAEPAFGAAVDDVAVVGDEDHDPVLAPAVSRSRTARMVVAASTRWCRGRCGPARRRWC